MYFFNETNRTTTDRLHTCVIVFVTSNNKTPATTTTTTSPTGNSSTNNNYNGTQSSGHCYGHTALSRIQIRKRDNTTYSTDTDNGDNFL